MDELLNSRVLFESTNLFFALIGVFGIYLNLQRKNLLYSIEAVATLRAWNWIFTGMIIRGAWFFFLWVFGGVERGRTFAESFFYEYRLIAIIASTTCIGWGVVSFYRIIEDRSVKWAVGVMGFLIVASLLGAL